MILVIQPFLYPGVKKIDMSCITDFDVILGEKVRTLRQERGISQDELGQAAGITFQQVQKHERAINRISASRLQVFADFLGVPITYFYNSSAESKELSIIPAFLLPLVKQLRQLSRNDIRLLLQLAKRMQHVENGEN